MAQVHTKGFGDTLLFLNKKKGKVNNKSIVFGLFLIITVLNVTDENKEEGKLHIE